VIDAHNHLHDARLAPWRAEIFTELAALRVQRAVVNGTRESDWAPVAALARAQLWVKPSFGLHPWYVAERSAAWLEKLRALLDATPGAAVGEIGLDRWIAGHDAAQQHTVFAAQLALAAERELPVTIHCLRAWGALWEVIRAEAVPSCGFLLHAYGGPAEMVPGFVKRGAYFSFNACFLHERKAAQRAVFAQIPADRLLVETDAPDMAPPAERRLHALPESSGHALNHPANLPLAYAGLAEIRSLSVPGLEALVAENFARLFGKS
jgi:TatD DNase family protein